MKKSLRIRFQQFMLRPRQCMITDAHSRGPVRKLLIRPLSFVSLILLAASVFMAAGAYLSGGVHQNNHRAQIHHLQLEVGRLKDSIAETEAMLSLRDQQIVSMKQEIVDLRQQKSAIQDKINMFNSILDARKGQGVHLLQIAAHKLSDQFVGYSFVLVKGGNYPRSASGTIRFSALSPDNEATEITLESGENTLPYRTQSHTFMQGRLPWNMSFQGYTLHIGVFDRRGKEIGQYEVKLSDQ